MPALQKEMQASSTSNFRYFTCLLDKGHISGWSDAFYYLLNLKGRRVDSHFRLSTYEKENYKNNVGCIIFMALVYPENMMESC